MSFHSRAWHSAADEYGKQRAEQYGRIARGIRTAKVIGALCLLLAMAYFLVTGRG